MRRSVPEGRLKIAAFQSSLRDENDFLDGPPNVETLGYCRMSLRDKELGGRTNCRMALGFSPLWRDLGRPALARRPPSSLSDLAVEIVVSA